MKIVLFSCVFIILVLQITGYVLSPGRFGRIVGGAPCNIDKHPYQVSIEIYGTQHRCGGTILSPTVIITAAQCTINKGLKWLQVRAGTTELGKDGAVRKLKTYHIHELYGLNTSADYDVSLIELTEPLELSEHIKAIALPEESEILNPGEMTTVTGWGTLDQENIAFSPSLNEVQIPVVNQELCKFQYDNMVTDRMMCAGNLEQGGKSPCTGDVGGPLVAQNKLHGITSWGKGCAEPWYPAVFTRITSVREWIRKTVNL